MLIPDKVLFDKTIGDKYSNVINEVVATLEVLNHFLAEFLRLRVVQLICGSLFDSHISAPLFHHVCAPLFCNIYIYFYGFS